MNARAVEVLARALALSKSPLLPEAVRLLIADLVGLLADLHARVATLEGKANAGKADNR